MTEQTTVSEIQDFLLKQKSDDPIDDKAKDRVTRQWAEGIKKNKDLPSGRCNVCAREEKRLIPATFNLCLTCCNKFMQRGGELEIIKKEVKDYHCDYCLTRTFVVMYVNPKLCSPCFSRLGRKHKYEMRDVNHEKKLIEKDKERRGMKT